MFDEEREHTNNELCKILANMAPFDGVLRAVRERALSNEKRKGFEAKLASLQDSEHFSTLKRAMGVGCLGFFTLSTIKPMLSSFLDEYEILCQDMPAGNECKADSLVEALNHNFQDVTYLWQPAFIKAVEALDTFSDAVCAALVGTAESGPAKVQWNQIIETHTSANATSGLQRCLTVMAGACTRTGIKAPEALKQKKHTLMKCCALSSLVTAICHLRAIADEVSASADEVAASADTEKMNTWSGLVGEACKMLKYFENVYDEKKRVHALNFVKQIDLHDV